MNPGVVSPRLMVVGSVALDSVETPFGKVVETLGGSAVHFSAAASFFTRVSLVGVVGQDFPQQELTFLKERNVDLSGLEIQSGRTFRWKGRYGFDLNTAETLETQLNVFADFSPKIPPALRRPEILFLGNIHPTLQKKVLDQVDRPRLVALDTMNFWIQGEAQALREVMGGVDLMVINEGEARQLADEPTLVRAARKIRSQLRPDGPQILVIKQGEYGALLFQEDDLFSAPGLPLEQVMDPTGAGDSFAGGLLGYLAKEGNERPTTLRQAVIVGSVMASFNVEDFSCRRLKSLRSEEIGRRVEVFKRLSHFDGICL